MKADICTRIILQSISKEWRYIIVYLQRVAVYYRVSPKSGGILQSIYKSGGILQSIYKEWRYIIEYLQRVAVYYSASALLQAESRIAGKVFPIDVEYVYSIRQRVACFTCILQLLLAVTLFSSDYIVRTVIVLHSLQINLHQLLPSIKCRHTTMAALIK